MKILVLQLARFGDIYLTWPALRALRRKYPEAEIHFLVRERFLAATEGLGADIRVRTLATADILRPILQADSDSESLANLEKWLEPLLSENWDQIVNLSFSPASSYLTNILTGTTTEVFGYSRHADGYLALPDDASAYFYAQVGPERFNRFHLVDVFAMVAQVDLQFSDWGFVGATPAPEGTPEVIVHLGASQAHKCYPVHHWREVLQRISPSGMKIGLIGSGDEEPLAKELAGIANVRSYVGQTKLVDVFSLLGKAKLLIGADSAPIHMAAHVGTPVLNLSFSSVNFWETGPLSKGSQVLLGVTPNALAPERVAQAIHAMLNGQGSRDTVRLAEGADGPRYEAEDFSFPWRLILALYTQSDYPPLPNDSVLVSAVRRLSEVTDLALEQLDRVKRKVGLAATSEILPSVDLALREIPKIAPAIAPLVAWFEAERVRIPPGDLTATLARTEKLFQDFRTIVSVFASNREPNLENLRESGLQRIEKINVELAECAQSFRLFQTAEAEPILQRVLEHLMFFEQNGFHHLDATKVEEFRIGPEIGAAWKIAYEQYHDILRRLIEAFERRDYLFVADLLEYEIASCIGEWRTQLVKWHDVVLT